MTPEVVDRILKKFGPEYIKSAFLVRHDKKKFVEDVHKSTTPNDWIIRRTKNEGTYEKIAEMVAEYSSFFEQEAKKYNLPVFLMDKNFEAQIEKITEFLTGV